MEIKKKWVLIIVGLIIILKIATMFFNLGVQTEEEIIYGQFNENKEIVYVPIECVFEEDNKLYFWEDCKQ